MAQKDRERQQGGSSGGRSGGRRERPAAPGRRKSCYFCKDKVDEVDWKNYNQLRRYVSEKGKIRSRRITGTCRRHQKQVAVAVKRARGFARNFLLPRELAEPATPSRVAELEKVNAHRALHEAQSFEQAQEISQRLGQTELRFDVKAGDTGVLFGSVTATDVADTLWEKHKIRVHRKKIELADPIKRIGRYEIPIELFADVVVPVRTLVIPEGGELP